MKPKQLIFSSFTGMTLLFLIPLDSSMYAALGLLDLDAVSLSCLVSEVKRGVEGLDSCLAFESALYLCIAIAFACVFVYCLFWERLVG
jgi:hypothetical protein